MCVKSPKQMVKDVADLFEKTEDLYWEGVGEETDAYCEAQAKMQKAVNILEAYILDSFGVSSFRLHETIISAENVL